MEKQTHVDGMYGTDADKEISLFEYGLLVKQHTDAQSPKPDEYFCVFAVGNDTYETGCITETRLNDIINGSEFAKEAAIASFLKSNGQTKDEWLRLQFVHKLADCLREWGHTNLFGSNYGTSITAEEARELYL